MPTAWSTTPRQRPTPPRRPGTTSRPHPENPARSTSVGRPAVVWSVDQCHLLTQAHGDRMLCTEGPAGAIQRVRAKGACLLGVAETAEGEGEGGRSQQGDPMVLPEKLLGSPERLLADAACPLALAELHQGEREGRRP